MSPWPCTTANKDLTWSSTSIDPVFRKNNACIRYSTINLNTKSAQNRLLDKFFMLCRYQGQLTDGIQPGERELKFTVKSFDKARSMAELLGQHWALQHSFGSRKGEYRAVFGWWCLSTLQSAEGGKAATALLGAVPPEALAFATGGGGGGIK